MPDGRWVVCREHRADLIAERGHLSAGAPLRGWLRKLTTHPGRPRRCPRRNRSARPVIGRPPEPPARPVPEPAPAFGFGSRRGFPVRKEHRQRLRRASTWAKWSRRRSTTLSRLRGRFNAAPPFGGRSSSSLSQRRAPHRRHSCSSSPSSSPQTGQIWMVGAVMPLPPLSAEAKGAQVALAGDALHGEPARASPVAPVATCSGQALSASDLLHDHDFGVPPRRSLARCYRMRLGRYKPQSLRRPRACATVRSSHQETHSGAQPRALAAQPGTSCRRQPQAVVRP